MGGELPWLQCDILNGTALFVIELSALHLHSRWTIIFPAVVGLLWTCVVMYTNGKTHAISQAPAAGTGKLTAEGSIGAVSAIVRTAYSIVELALLVASVTTMLEADHRTWGPMAAIPLLVLGMIRSSRTQQTTSDAHLPPHSTTDSPDPIFNPPPHTPKDGAALAPQQQRGHFNPSLFDSPPAAHQPASNGDIFKAAVAHLLQTVVFTDTMHNALAVAAGITVLFGTAATITPSSSQMAYHNSNSLLAGIASGEDPQHGSAADSPVITVILMMLLLPSTPVFGGGRDLVFRSDTVRRFIPPEQLPLVTSALSAVWYSLLFSLRIATPTVVSWSGALMLISCSLLLVNSFKVVCPSSHVQPSFIRHHTQYLHTVYAYMPS